jgi:hypothetical protein
LNNKASRNLAARIFGAGGTGLRAREHRAALLGSAATSFGLELWAGVGESLDLDFVAKWLG